MVAIFKCLLFIFFINGVFGRDKHISIDSTDGDVTINGNYINVNGHSYDVNTLGDDVIIKNGILIKNVFNDDYLNNRGDISIKDDDEDYSAEDVSTTAKYENSAIILSGTLFMHGLFIAIGILLVF